MISPELSAQNEREMEELSPKDYRSVSSSINDFTGDNGLKVLVRGWLKGNRITSILMCNLHLVFLISEHPRHAPGPEVLRLTPHILSRRGRWRWSF